MSPPLPVPLRVKKQEKYLAKNLASNTHFTVDEVEALFNMYRQVCGNCVDKKVRQSPGKWDTLFRMHQNIKRNFLSEFHSDLLYVVYLYI